MNRPAPHLSTVRVHGLDFVDLDPTQLRDELERRLLHGPSTAVFTPNALIGDRALGEVELHRLLGRADLLLPDGQGVLAASRRQTPHAPLRYRLPGIEAGETVLHLCAAHGRSVYFLGGKEGVAAAAARHWQARLPGLRVVGHRSGYFDKWGEEGQRVCADIAARAPDVLIVCFGFPCQERWIVEHRDALPSVRLFLGLGGSMDVWAGRVRRAPLAFRRAHLEWLWRGLCQPRRLGDVPRLLHYVLTPTCGENQRISLPRTFKNSQNQQN